MTGPLRIAMYARVSSQMQSEAGTIQSQIAEILDRARNDGVAIPETLRFIDDGFSGASLLRPALERLRDQAAAGAIDCVYVHSPDRLARRYAYQVLLVDEFDRANAELRFLNRDVGSSPEDALLLQVQGMIAEYERVKIMERSRRGKRHAARCGSVHVFGRAPFGYRYVTKHEGGGDAPWEIVLEEARIVQRMFELVGLSRGSIRDVCRMLNGDGIPTSEGKRRWKSTTVGSMLRNPAYKGMAAYGRTRKGPVRHRLRPKRSSPGFPRRGKSVYPVDSEEWIHVPVPPIVSDDLFDTVQEQLTENRRRIRRRHRASLQWLLQGLVVCKHCGYACYGKTTCSKNARGQEYRYTYYRCAGTDAYRYEGSRTCNNTMVRAEVLEEAVWREVEKLLADPQRLEVEFARRASATEGKDGAAYKTRIDRLRRGIQRLIDSYAEGLIEKAEFKPRIQDRKARLARLEEEAAKAHEIEGAQQQMRLVVGRVEAFAEQVDSGLASMDWKARQELVRCLVKEVKIGRKEVTVSFRVDPVPFAAAPGRNRGFVQHCPTRRRAQKHADF